VTGKVALGKIWRAKALGVGSGCLADAHRPKEESFGRVALTVRTGGDEAVTGRRRSQEPPTQRHDRPRKDDSGQSGQRKAEHNREEELPPPHA
jgi:hypothetical protein